MKYTIERAHKFIAESEPVNPMYRQKHHFMGEVGWINDPNGFIYYKNEYHLFYQYYPYNSQWGAVHWGHAKSKDLLNWEKLPIALAPEESYETGGCFSGSAIEVKDTLYLMYTGHIPNEDHELTRQVQCVAKSKDGITFDKLSQNPVIGSDKVPDIASLQDVRDPKVFEKNGKYYSVVSSKTSDNRGLVLLYVSNNMIDWEYKSIFFEGTKELGTLIECPDYFEIDGKGVLIASTLEMSKEKYKYYNINSCIVMIGEVDWEAGVFHQESIDELDKGLDFYAPQTLHDDQGRRIMIAWMQIPGRSMPTHDLGHKWGSCLTIPRELSIIDNRLVQNPVREIKKYMENTLSLDGLKLKDEKYVLESINETVSVIDFEMDLNLANSIQFGVGFNSSESIKLTYNKLTEELEIDRLNSGIKITDSRSDNPWTRKIKVKTKNGFLKLSILLDTSSIEVFVQDGEAVMTSTFYPTKYEGIHGYFKVEGAVEFKQCLFYEMSKTNQHP